MFRLDEADPVIWQLSFTDSEITKMLETREREMLRNKEDLTEWRT